MMGAEGLDVGAKTVAGTAAVLVEVLIAIALYNVIELNFIIFATFRRRSGTYFWSFLVATWGIAVYSVGFLTKDLGLIREGFIYASVVVVGWPAMVTGQSVVLWSRIHLLVRNRKVLRAILAVIVVNALIGHVPVAIMLYGINSKYPDRWTTPYAIYERVQVTIFFLQELGISTIYIVKTTKLLGAKSPRDTARTASGRRFLTQLIYINVIVVALDLAILGLEYAGIYVIQTAYKGLAYSVKLKLEVSILNSLVDMVKGPRGARGSIPRAQVDSNSKSERGDRGGSGSASLMQTVDSDGRIRYTSRLGNTVCVMASRDGPEAPEPVHPSGNVNDGSCSVVMTRQFHIHRERREEWEESDMDEMVESRLPSDRPFVYRE